jgi:hypothetical protein
MARDPRKLQKKRAKKAAKRKAVVAAKKKPSGGLRGFLTGASQIALATRSPIHECLMPQELFETGMGTVIVSRSIPNGRIGASFFLLDVFCLGVKNAYFTVISPEEYDYRLSEIRQRETLTLIHPTCARKVVEQAEAYARDLGFEPHADYRLAKKIFGDIDAAACPTSFTFGKDGKPLFISGPTDTPARIEKIMATLTKRYGPEGFHYLVGMGGEFDFDDGEEIEVEYEELEGEEKE